MKTGPSNDSDASFRLLSAFTPVLAGALVVAGLFETEEALVVAGVVVTAAALVAARRVALVESLVLALAGMLVLAEVFVSAVALLLVVAQPLRKNPKSNDNRIEGLTVRVIFELIKICG
ncbi:hypothetical protein [Nitrosospira sp. Is2]|uniref:hypothetical protein n=1 Tax=Nitrosospira sp. Is2 TaxID=3080532 RepID=UPI002954B3BF|nr:hypothetical protein [Nitrosospira sp. Is2]WON75507.1 hypothetical protein R5L00_12205 [Nitrosospira sp. Is2]